MKKLNKKGFTLIELLAVIVILGILMLVAIPAVTKYINSSKMKAFQNNAVSLIDAVRNDAALKDFSNCYASIDAIDLEKGSKENLTGYVFVDSTEEGADKYKITIKDTKNGYVYTDATESHINGNDPATTGDITALETTTSYCSGYAPKTTE